MKKLIFEGVGTALITPMRNGKIDYDALFRIIELQIEGGVDALIVGGTTAEAATLNLEEREELYSAVKEAVRGRSKLIFGTGTNDTREVLLRNESAEKIGCDGILVVTPYYNKGTFLGVTEHYRRIAESTSLPVILYNVPQRTGVNLTAEQLSTLSKIENIVAIKEASDSADRLTELAAFGDELYLYAGNDSQIFLTAALGGKGVISVISNIFPKTVKKLYKRYASGDAKGALEIQIKLMPFIKALFSDTNPSPIKYAMSLLGLCSSELRLPLLEPSEGNRRLIEKELTSVLQFVEEK